MRAMHFTRTQNCVMVNLLNRWKWFRKRLVRCGLRV
uniref:Uncharacterized protein n=1 Tax=Podoviridae sp. ctxqo3 TaxID=2827755 RepID=A0A8S5SYS5_9CAUD|nr:MAG TPA: hypothetical protein [Podoviridae sp. ctxqo3]